MFSRKIWVLAVFVAGCLPEPKTPDAQNLSNDSLLSRKQMVDLMIDLHVAESRAVQGRINGADTVQAFYNRLVSEAFKRHKTDSSTYNKSFRYYSTKPHLLDSIYNNIVDSLGLMESKTPPFSKP